MRCTLPVSPSSAVGMHMKNKTVRDVIAPDGVPRPGHGRLLDRRSARYRDPARWNTTPGSGYRPRTGVKYFHHPVVGDLELAFEAMDLSADQGLVLTAYSPEPATPSADGIALLASWLATADGTAGSSAADTTTDAR
jgi:hypothetical protein